MKTIKIVILAGLLATSLLLPACDAPSWAAEAEKIAEVALPIVEGITSIAGAGPTVTKVESDINLLITLFGQYQATPAAGTLQEIQAGLSTANADLTQIMPVAGVKNSATQNKLTAVLQLVASEFSNITSLIPAAGGTQPAAAGGGAPATKLPFTAKEFKAQYNRIVKTPTGDADCDRAFAGKELK